MAPILLGHVERTSVSRVTSIHRLRPLFAGLLIEDYLCRFPELGTGENVAEELVLHEFRVRHDWADKPTVAEVVRRFPTRPSLRAALERQATELRAARRQKAGITTTTQPTESSGRLQIRCPHCNNSTNVAADASLAEIICEICGSQFSLVATADEPTNDARMVSRLGRFELLERLGMGQFGTVWKARDPELDRTVAVKIPRKDRLSRDEIDKFLKEARAAAQLRHDNIVAVHEIGRDGDTVFIVSNLIRGVTLSNWLTQRRPTTRESAALCATIAKAIDHAHENGVIHRDLKPANIMMDNVGTPYIMDFGLARREKGELTLTADGLPIGTAAYMSPEQARGEGHRADGAAMCIPWEQSCFNYSPASCRSVATRRWSCTSLSTMNRQIRRKLNGGIPRDLDTICRKCLEREPTRRYQTASDVADELNRFLRDEPIVARPIARSTRVWRWCRRNPMLAGALAAAFVLSFGIAIQQLVAGHRLRIEQALSDTRRQEAEAARQTSAEQLAQFQLVQGIDLLDGPSPAKGLHSLVKALEHSIANDVDHVEVATRKQLSARKDQFHQLRAVVGHKEPVPGVAIAPDGRTFATASLDDTAQLWDATTGSPIGPPLQHDGWVEAVTFSPDGTTLITAAADGMVRLWDVATGRLRIEPLVHERPLVSVAISKDGSKIVSGSHQVNRSSEVRQWSTTTGELIGKPMPHSDEVRGVCFTSDGSRILTACLDRCVRIWDATTGAEIGKRLQLRLPAWSVAIDDQGQRIAVGTGEFYKGEVLVFGIGPDLEITAQPLVARQSGAVRSVAFDSDGSRILASSLDRTARVFDAATLEPVGAPLEHNDTVCSTGFTKDGRFAVTSSNDGTARFWELAAPKPRITVSHRSWIEAIAWSQDGECFATASWDNTARVWDAKTGQPKGPALVHPKIVTAIAFLDSSSQVITGCRDGKLRVWDLKSQPYAVQTIVIDDKATNVNSLARQVIIRRWLSRSTICLSM